MSAKPKIVEWPDRPVDWVAEILWVLLCFTPLAVVVAIAKHWGPQ